MQHLCISFMYGKKGFFLIIREKGSTNGNKVKVKNLIAPNFKYWDSKEQKFMEATENAIHNNRILYEMRLKYETALNSCNYPVTPAELKKIVETGQKVQSLSALTLGTYLQQLINQMKYDKNKKPSKNYQNYITLLHKLEAEKQIINVPLADICNNHFKQFGAFLLGLSEEEGKGNYTPLMKRFKTVLKRANEEELNEHSLTYKFENNAPTKEVTEKFTLTMAQYDKFLKLDLDSIPQSGPNPSYYKELYHDFCIFLYEMKMRPIDVVKIHHDNIKFLNDKDTYLIYYTAEKKKNYRKNKLIKNRITDRAMRIIQKYKGKSSQGYVFPFAMNEYHWDFNDAVSLGKWYNRKQYTLEKINSFLKKIAPFIGAPEDGFTLYSFRHSVLTHEIMAKEKDPLTIAQEAGTSVNMIEKHYYNYEATIAKAM